LPRGEEGIRSQRFEEGPLTGVLCLFIFFELHRYGVESIDRFSVNALFSLAIYEKPIPLFFEAI